MSGKNSKSFRILILATIMPVFLLLSIDYSLNGSLPNFNVDQINPRIANSALTSFILASLFLLGNMFFYGESRNRPLAPLFGMSLAILIGILSAIFFINQGPILLEDNGSVRAQMVYNIAHGLVSILAISLSVIISVGVIFSSITNSTTRVIVEKKYEQE